MLRSMARVTAITMIAAAPSLAHAQSSPREQAQVLTSAIASGDSASIRSLLSPASASFAGDDRVAAPIRGILGKRGLAAEALAEEGPIDVRAVSVQELDEYDPSSRRDRLGPIAFEFSPDATPSHFLFIDRTEPVSGGSTTRIMSRGIVEGIVQVGGRWYLTVSRLAR